MRYRITPTAKSAQGFTLFELLIVMLIIALAAGIVLPRFTGNDLNRLKAQVREVVSILKHARHQAVIRGQEQSVSLHSLAKTNPTPPAAVPKNTARDWFSKGAEVTAKEEAEREKEAYIVHFYPSGGSNGGTFQFKQGKFTAEITIHPLTGKSKIHFPETKD